MEFLDREESSDESNCHTDQVPKKKEIILSDKQEECVAKLEIKMRKYHNALNASYMGRGKSIMTIELIRRLKIKNALLICPSNMLNSWTIYDEEYDVGFVKILTYDTLRGTSNNNIKNNKVTLKHGLLTRNDKEFEVTKKFMKLVAEGLWIFCDECQKIKKKDRIQRKALIAMCKAVMSAVRSEDYTAFSGVHMFSATPFYEEEHCVNYCYTSALIVNPLFPESGLENSGLLELKKLCMEIDVQKTNRIWGVSELKPKKAEKIAFNLCVEILIPELSAFVIEDVNGINQTIFYTHEKMSKIGMQILRASEEMIHKSRNKSIHITEEMETKYAKIIGADPKNKILSKRSRITQGQITAQVIKTYYIIIPLAQRILEEISNAKVVIFLEYKEAIAVAESYLRDYGVIILTGSSTLRTGERDRLISKFQEPNLDYRVLITICQVGSVSLEFDDKHGDFPRFGLMPLIHSTEYLLQSAGRIDRKDTKSHSLFFVCKVDNGGVEIEQSLIKTTEKKSKILEKTLKNNGIIPPVNFVNVYDMRNKNFEELLEKAGTFEYGGEKREEEESIIVIRKSNIVLDL